MKTSLLQTKIYIDCTHTFFFGRNTGIQRTVRNIVTIMPQIAPQDTHIIPMLWVGSKFLAVPHLTFDRGQGIHAFFIYMRRMIKPYFYYLPQWARRTMRPFITLFAFLLINGRYLFYKKIIFKEGDVIFFADSSWNESSSRHFWNYIKKAKEQGARVGFLFYDIIPIRHPSYCIEEFISRFKSWFSKAIELSHFFIAISDTVRKDIVSFVEKNNLPCPLNGFNYLGASLDSAQRNKTNTTYNGRLLPIFDKNPIFIYVSTIEIRKNHDYALSAFELLWKEHNFQGKFFIIGAMAWSCEKIIERILNHPEYNKRLFMMHDINDSELAYIYTHATGSIFTSLTEGFGLPIIESLAYGLAVFASDIPVHREIGGDMISYCDLSRPEHLADQLREFMQNPIRPRIPASYRKNHSWEVSCTGLLERIKTLTSSSYSSISH